MMWFAKWFGGRRKAREDAADEPARFAPVEPRQATQPVSATHPAKNTDKALSGRSQKQGFDPYNSGAFKRQNAWERVNRR